MDSLENNIQGLRRVVSAITGLPLSNIVIDFSNRRQSQNPSGLYCVVTRKNVRPLGMPQLDNGSIRQEAEVRFNLSFVGDGAMTTSFTMLGGQFLSTAITEMAKYSIGFKNIWLANGTNNVGRDNTYIESSVVGCTLWVTLDITENGDNMEDFHGFNVTDENNNPIG